MDIRFSRDLLMNIRLSWDLDINIRLGWDLLMDIRLCRDWDREACRRAFSHYCIIRLYKECTNTLLCMATCSHSCPNPRICPCSLLHPSNSWGLLINSYKFFTGTN